VTIIETETVTDCFEVAFCLRESADLIEELAILFDVLLGKRDDLFWRVCPLQRLLWQLESRDVAHVR
jgi:hypothetical protein